MHIEILFDDIISGICFKIIGVGGGLVGIEIKMKLAMS